VNDEACVELAQMDKAIIGIRDSKAPDGPRFSFSVTAVAELVKRVKRNELDL
jgi:hypothetical protein